MQIVHIERLINTGEVASSADWQRVEKDVFAAISTIQWPPDAGRFILNPVTHGNGVVPIKEACMVHLVSQGWMMEYVLSAIGTGKIDAALRSKSGLYGVEWETGNISSSHRAINKMALALLKNVITGGILILPSRKMYRHLTDRIGNFPELKPYFPLWQALSANIAQGVLEIIVIEHDAESPDIPLITKGTDGRALV